jgi:uncharacterized membrane protein
MGHAAAMRRPTSSQLLTGLLVGAGVLHFVAPEPYASIVPKRLGDPLPWVYGSGVAEIAVGALVAAPRTRRLGGLAAAGLFVGVFPANVSMALDASRPAALHRAALARLPLQVPLVVWAMRVAQAGQAPNA